MSEREKLRVEQNRFLSAGTVLSLIGLIIVIGFQVDPMKPSILAVISGFFTGVGFALILVGTILAWGKP